MSLLNLDLSDVVELHAVEPDKEYQVRLVEIREGVDKNNNPYLMPRFEILDEVGAQDFSQYFALPNSTMDAKRVNSAKLRLKQFIDCFGLDIAEAMENWVGRTGWVILGIKEDEQYGPQNYIKRFVGRSK